jgi:hypothetical protein
VKLKINFLQKTEIMNKNIMLYIAGFIIALIIICVAIYFLSSRKERMRPAIGPIPESSMPMSDVITIHQLTQGNVLVTHSTARYEMVMPLAWYLEKKSGGGVAVYPGYELRSKTPPLCKLEISFLENPSRADLNDWLTDYLHQDPTGEVAESSRVSSTISGHYAITWTGVWNGVLGTFIYISRGDGSLYEIAPSTIEGDFSLNSPQPTSAVELCSSALNLLLSSFHILP